MDLVIDELTKTLTQLLVPVIAGALIAVLTKLFQKFNLHVRDRKSVV